MKKSIYLFAAIVFFTLTSKAAVYTVSNNTSLPGSPGQYTTISSAMTAASNGDTILIQGSPFDYGSFTVTKGLTFIGAGYNPQTSTGYKSQASTITIGNGSSNCKFIGLYMENTSPVMTLPVTNISFMRCYFNSGLTLTGGSPNMSGTLLVENCYFFTGQLSLPINSVTVRNCIFSAQAFINGNALATTHYIRNNLFVCQSGSALTQLNNSVIENNIFFGSNTVANNTSTSTFNNNYVYGITSLPPAGNIGSGNITDQIAIYPVFQSCGSYNYATDFRPMVSSVVHNAGTDGTDIGPTGGSAPVYLYPAPYPLTGEPPVPQVREVLLPVSSVPSGGTLNINVKARKTN